MNYVIESDTVTPTTIEALTLQDSTTGVDNYHTYYQLSDNLVLAEEDLHDSGQQQPLVNTIYVNSTLSLEACEVETMMDNYHSTIIARC